MFSPATSGPRRGLSGPAGPGWLVWAGWPACAGLAGPEHSQRWNQILADRIEALGTQIERMVAAREYLEHILLHHHAAPDGCPHYEALIWEPSADGLPHSHHEPPIRSLPDG